MKEFKFKKLEIKKEGSWLKRNIGSNHFKKTVLYSFIGASLGYALFYFGQDVDSPNLWNDEAMQNVFIGFGFGIFITNSPCARGRC